MSIPAYCPSGKTFYPNALTSAFSFSVNSSNASFSSSGLAYSTGSFTSTVLTNLILNTDFSVGFTIENMDPATPYGGDTAGVYIDFDSSSVTDEQVFGVYRQVGYSTIRFLTATTNPEFSMSIPTWPAFIEWRLSFISGTTWNIGIYVNGSLVHTISGFDFSGFLIDSPNAVRLKGSITDGPANVLLKDFFVMGQGFSNQCPLTISYSGGAIPSPFSKYQGDIRLVGMP